MEQIEQRFLEAYRYALIGEPTVWNEDISVSEWKRLFRIAGNHAVTAMIYETVRDTESFQNVLVAAMLLIRFVMSACAIIIIRSNMT